MCVKRHQITTAAMLVVLLFLFLFAAEMTAFAADQLGTSDQWQNSSISELEPNTTSNLQSTQTEVQNGNGNITYADGTAYTGLIRNGKPDGKGSCKWSNGDSYAGEFSTGNMNGQGTYTWAGGEKYIGSFVNGCRTGQGVYTWPRGARYKGEFSNDKFNGTGELIWPSDRFYGKGLIVQPSGVKVTKDDSGFNYKGSFKDGLMHGKGVYTWSNGDKYTGDFQTGKRTGSGQYTWSNGNSYTGEFKDDNLDGFGYFNWANGDSFAGYFLGGMPTGFGRFTASDNKVSAGNWDKGVRKAGGVDIFASIPNDIYNTQPVTFSWQFDGKSFELGPMYVTRPIMKKWQSKSVHYTLYRWGVQIPSSDSIKTYSQDVSNDDMTNAVAFALNETAYKEGFTGAKLINFVASFVQSLPNNKDPLTYPFDGYTKFPYEVLFPDPINTKVDSEDTSMLAALLLQRMGYYTSILYMPAGIPAHAAVGVKGDVSFPAERFYYKGSWYYYLETTAGASGVGIVPKGISSNAVEIVPLPDPVGGRLLTGNNK